MGHRGSSVSLFEETVSRLKEDSAKPPVKARDWCGNSAMPCWRDARCCGRTCHPTIQAANSNVRSNVVYGIVLQDSSGTQLIQAQFLISDIRRSTSAFASAVSGNKGSRAVPP